MVGDKKSMFINDVKNFIHKYFFSSFKSTINTIYIFIIIIMIAISGTLSFLLASKQVEENAYDNLHDTVLQTNNYINFILSEIFQQLYSFSNNPLISELILSESGQLSPSFYVDIDRELKRIYYNYNEFIESILVDVDHGKYTFYESPDFNIVNPEFSYHHYFDLYQGNKESFYWKNVHKDNIFQHENNVLTVFKLIGNEDSSSKGIILFNLRTSFLEEILNNSLMGENGYITLISPDSSFESKHVGKRYQLKQETLDYINNLDEENGQFTVENNNNNLIVNYTTVGINNWKVAAVVPQNEILDKVNYIKYITILIIALMIVISIFLVNVVGKYISKPINKLANQMRTVHYNDIKFDYDATGPEEMKTLYSSFNELISRNNKLLNNIKQEKEEKRQLEIAIIQAQIKPHFLYNTLYSIKSLSDMGLNEDASKMVSALASFFRISISKGNEIIQIESEIEHIKNYLYIMEMRYGDEFSYQINIEPDILPYNIIKLTLQPLIENAIYHGIKTKRGMSLIEIKGFLKNETIHFEVIDDGIGIENSKLKEILKELKTTTQGEKKIYTGIGLKNVNDRIKSIFGEAYGLWIESAVNKGTKVSITIPTVKKENT